MGQWHLETLGITCDLLIHARAFSNQHFFLKKKTPFMTLGNRNVKPLKTQFGLRLHISVWGAAQNIWPLPLGSFDLGANPGRIERSLKWNLNHGFVHIGKMKTFQTFPRLLFLNVHDLLPCRDWILTRFWSEITRAFSGSFETLFFFLFYGEVRFTISIRF